MANEQTQAIEVLPSDKVTMVPYGFKGEKISIAQMIKTKEFQSLDPRFAVNVLAMIRDNPTIGILKGGAERSEEQVRNLFYANYKKLDEQKDYENIPSFYSRIKNGKIKWNPEDNQWYRLATKKVVAVPGGSWHTGGYAVDFTGDTALAGKVAKNYNIAQITSTGEKHHFQPAGLPTSKRMFKYLEERYGLDPISNPLPKDLIDWIDSEVASNVPRQPERILSQLDQRIAAYKNSSSPKISQGLEQLDSSEKTFSTTTTTTTLPPTTTVPPTTTTTLPATTTTLPPTTTSVPPTTTQPPTATAAPTTTVEEKEPIAGQRSTAPSKYEYAGPTTTAPKRTTTTSAAPQTTIPPTTTSTTMAEKTTTTSTTEPPSPSTTIPGQVGTGGFGITPTGGAGFAGGVTQNYKPPTKAQLTDAANPYVYTNEDWQILLTMPQSDVVLVQQNLMKAYPGFKPGSLGNRYDPKTIKYFKSALGRINQLAADPEDSFGVGVRGKTTVDAIKAISKVPMALTGSEKTSLPAYRLTSPTDLKAVFKKASQDMLGRTLGDGDLNRLVQAYQSSELQYQKTVASGAPQGVAAAPDPTTFAMEKIQKDFGEEVDTNKIDSIFSAVDRALSGGQR